MLQRVQSIYLLLSSLAIFSLFLFPLVQAVYVNGTPVSLMVTGVYQDVNGARVHTEFFVALSVATGIVGLLPLIVIFLYRNRKQQVAFSYGTMLVVIGYSFWVAQTGKSVLQSTTLQPHNWGIGLFMSSLSLVFLMLAVKAIQRDEKLVRSADRLR